jgi:hypothetical protein
MAAGGCAHVANETPAAAPTPSAGATSSASASASASPTPSPTPSGLCTITTRDPNATVVVSIDPDFAAASTTYGTVFGYAVYDPTGTATFPPSAQAISAKTSDLVVFANYDPGTITHSAAGFAGATSFPAEPYPIPTNEGAALATSITSSAWSTGPLQSFGNSSSTVCYSQTFSLPSPGTYYFGDDPLYNSPSSYRGVIVVSQ